MRLLKYIPLVLLSQLLILSPVSAHMQDMYNADRVFEIRLGEGFVDIRLLFAFKEFPSLEERMEMDSNEDDLISENEAGSYAGKYLEDVISGIELTVDGRKLELAAVSQPRLDLYGSLRVVPRHHDLTVELSSRVNFPENGNAKVRFRLLERKRWPHPGKEVFALVAARRFAVDSTSLDGLTEQVDPEILRDISFLCRKRSAGEIEKAVTGGESNWRIVKFAQSYNFPRIVAVSRAKPSISMSSNVPDRSVIESDEEEDRQLREMVRGYLEGSGQGNSSLWIILAMAFIYGCVHALAPGHAKTLTAAYLVGSRHRWPHALALAGVVTLTHTGTILILAIITKLAWGGGLGAATQALLSGFSGLIVLALGIQRLRGGSLHSHKHNHNNDHHHHSSSHDHSHETEKVAPAEKGSYTQILWLGFAGGLAPCPGAIWIYFLALGFGRPGLGVALVISLSLGLALVLMIVGFATIYFRRFLGGEAGAAEQSRGKARLPSFLKLSINRLVAALPTVAGTALVVIGSFLIWRSLSSLGLV